LVKIDFLALKIGKPKIAFEILLFLIPYLKTKPQNLLFRLGNI
jgi:hypothetical protein